ncbi:MAG: indolepyruvate ferredoxin oxidoreductase family protein, partial [Proteobacteria bacterium]|nr:indolepyruvate ferredoxin oxidoreductase family protein [Pseudomonadota bacterium]
MSQLRDVTLEDKYLQETGQVFVTGIQALVRLPMLQHQLDSAMGLNTAGYVTGYRGSPLGALDQQFALASDYLTEKNIKFLPAVNEDLAATAVWGSQQAGLNGNGRFDGVFSLWYAKGPGVDRSGDPLRHGNLAGTSPYGGVLILMGDDHTCESSTTAHQSEFSLVNTFIPILNPAGVQDILDFGLYGWALSRYSGCWIGLKGVHDTVEASASISIDPNRINASSPVDFRMPADGLNLRWPDTPQAQEQRLHQFKLPAVSEFTFENPIDRQVLGDKTAEIGIISTGKSYLDVRRALLELGINDHRARRLG